MLRGLDASRFSYLHGPLDLSGGPLGVTFQRSSKEIRGPKTRLSAHQAKRDIPVAASSQYSGQGEGLLAGYVHAIDFKRSGKDGVKIRP